MPAVVQFRAGEELTVRSAANIFLGSLGTFSQAELTVELGDNPLYHPVSSAPVVTIPGR